MPLRWEICLHNRIIGDQLVAKRKGERFKRIKCSTLAKLLQENNNDESVYNLADQPLGSDQVSYGFILPQMCSYHNSSLVHKCNQAAVLPGVATNPRGSRWTMMTLALL
jgi:hypothetical protein